MRAIYFVHDLNDPAIGRRIAMLRAGGIDVAVAGFWRGQRPAERIHGAPALPLGRTYDAHMLHRAVSSAAVALRAPSLRGRLGRADVLIARNLEMLAAATAFNALCGKRAALVYEVLDLHRFLLSAGRIGRILRTIERTLLAGADLVITSSPAFVREYFEPVQFRKVRTPIAVVENKLLSLGRHPGHEGSDLPFGPPWQIGWFGMIRCSRSLEILGSIANRRPDLLQVLIAGRPPAAVFPAFERLISTMRGVTFLGAYKMDEIGDLYRRVHFNWAIDYFEENANSKWLLSNRIYEGGAYNAVPFALSSTETGRWLAAKCLGVRMTDPAKELEGILDRLTADRYRELKTAMRNMPRSTFIAGTEDCDRLTSILRRAIERRRCSRIGGAPVSTCAETLSK